MTPQKQIGQIIIQMKFRSSNSEKYLQNNPDNKD